MRGGVCVWCWEFEILPTLQFHNKSQNSWAMVCSSVVEAAIPMHLASSTVNGNVCKHTIAKKVKIWGQKSIQMLGVFSQHPPPKKVTYMVMMDSRFITYVARVWDSYKNKLLYLLIILGTYFKENFVKKPRLYVVAWESKLFVIFHHIPHSFQLHCLFINSTYLFLQIFLYVYKMVWSYAVTF